MKNIRVTDVVWTGIILILLIGGLIAESPSSEILIVGGVIGFGLWSIEIDLKNICEKEVIPE